MDYIGFIKPIKCKFDYILLNDFGEINSMTKNASEKLFLSSKFVSNNALNILLIAPKILRFLFFGEFEKMK